MHDEHETATFSTYDYHDNRGIIMTIMAMTLFIIAQH